MSVRSFIADLLRGGSEVGFTSVPDAEGLNVVLPQDLFDSCSAGNAGSVVLHQFISLQMLVEEGLAEELPNGFAIPTEDAVRLDDDIRYLLELPTAYPGDLLVSASGSTFHASFSLSGHLKLPSGDDVSKWSLIGPVLSLSSSEYFLLNEPQWLAFETLVHHANLDADSRSEYENLLAINRLHNAREVGASVNLGHFEDLDTVMPTSVGVSIKQREDGGADLSPSLGPETSPEDVNQRLGQISNDKKSGSLRVQDQIVLLNEDRMGAVQEIISKKSLSKEQFSQFLKTPGAFLDASLVDLDLGFSLRVAGAEKFAHGYFGDTDGSGIDWLEGVGSVPVNESVVESLIEDQEDVEELRTRIADAQRAGADVVEYKDVQFSLDDPGKILRELDRVANRIAESELGEESVHTEPGEKIVVDIIKNDENLEIDSRTEQNEFYDGKINWESYKRKPYPHQEKGVRWLLGISRSAASEGYGQGCLLADDMGLGKTFTALVAINEAIKWSTQQGKIAKPVLVVAPLSLLETWKRESADTYRGNDYNVVILQSDADLRRFRVEGGRPETKGQPGAEPKYALKVGPDFGTDRLDLPSRIVLTTYQTLRDYQFSLCQVGWSFSVFDEAQNIKNPNALQTRAAKGLKSDFFLLLTGTPVENHLKDFWCLIDTACPGLLGAYQDFRRTYVTPIVRSSPDQAVAVREKVGMDIREAVGGRMLRRLKEDHLEGLPQKRIIVGGEESEEGSLLAPEMQDIQRARYESIVNAAAIENDLKKRGSRILASLQQLRDVSLHPRLVDGGMLISPTDPESARSILSESAKLEALLSTLDRIRERDEKVLIFLINKRLQAFLKSALSRIYDLTVNVVNGDVKAVSKRASSETRTRYIEEFESRKGFGILILSPIAAGVGLTIVGANNVVHLERHWNPAKEAQATDRVYRIGQRRDVNIYIPILRHPKVDSFDVKLHRLLEAKTQLRDAIVTPQEVTTGELYTAGLLGETFTNDPPLEVPDLVTLPWKHFEALVALLAEHKYGGNARLISAKDKGCDVVVLGDSSALLQCKHTAGTSYSQEEAVDKLLAAKEVYERTFSRDFECLALFTNASEISRSVRRKAQRLNVEIHDGASIGRLLLDRPTSNSEVIQRLADDQSVTV